MIYYYCCNVLFCLYKLLFLLFLGFFLLLLLIFLNLLDLLLIVIKLKVIENRFLIMFMLDFLYVRFMEYIMLKKRVVVIEDRESC